MYPRQYSSDLSSAFSGSDADLEANRKGYLTTWQLENLPFQGATTEEEQVSFTSAVGAAVTTLAGAVVAFAFFAFLQGAGYELTNMLPPTVRPIAITIIVVAVVISLLWVAYAVVFQTRAARDWVSQRLSTMHVEAITGRVEPTVDRFEGEERYYVQIGTRRLHTSKRMLAEFRPGETYRLYYVNSPNGHWLVNAEDLSEKDEGEW
jgi:hypothetical protein